MCYFCNYLFISYLFILLPNSVFINLPIVEKNDLGGHLFILLKFFYFVKPFKLDN